MTNRLLEPSSGTIYLGDVDVRTLEKTVLRRQMGYVIQQVGLFPHMTVAKNIAVVPELLGWEKGRIAARVDELLELVQLPVEFGRRYPSQLSGGQQQRVGLARALAADPEVLLMDEPFGAIDAITRQQLQEEVRRLQDRLKKTILFVTHDVDEALKLADLLVIMRRGQIVQQGESCELLSAPADDFVRNLLNADDRIRQISLLPLEAAAVPAGPGDCPDDNPQLDSRQEMRKALSILLEPDVDCVWVTRQGVLVGKVTLDTIRKVGCR
jgi:osmoprotectant transport system ATP-binding protein